MVNQVNCTVVQQIELDKRLRDIATELQDSQLLSNFLVAESNYHINCLVSYNKCCRRFKRVSACLIQFGNAEESVVKARAFVELFRYLSKKTCTFKMALRCC